MQFNKFIGGLTVAFFFVGSGLGAGAGCSSTNNTVPLNDSGKSGSDTGGGGMEASMSCSSGATLVDDFNGCASCKFSSSANPSTCQPGRTVNACCAWVQQPSATLARAVGLHDYSSNDPTVDFSCLGTPPKAGTSHNSTLTGFVKIFSSGTDTKDVKVEVFKVDTTTGALGAQVGTTYTTSASDKVQSNNWLHECLTNPCAFRQYTIMNVPTETPLVIKTSDGGDGIWSPFYDYNIYFSNDSTCVSGGGPCVASSSGATWQTQYDVNAVASADIETVAGTVGLTVMASQGVLAGEVHDCGDIRISGANVDTDQPHDGAMFYFNDDESDPLPDETRSSQDLGTGKTGLFGALNFAPGVPIRISAIGEVGGKDTLLGTNVVQVYAGPSVTALSMRGRRPYQ